MRARKPDNYDPIAGFLARTTKLRCSRTALATQSICRISNDKTSSRVQLEINGYSFVILELSDLLRVFQGKEFLIELSGEKSCHFGNLRSSFSPTVRKYQVMHAKKP